MSRGPTSYKAGSRPVAVANTHLQFYRVAEAARLLNIAKPTIYTKVRQGLLPAFTVVGGIKGYTAEQIASIYAGA